MITDQQLIGLIVSLYEEPSYQWDDILYPEADDGVAVALKRFGDDTAIVLRGSVTPQDWLRDLFALPQPVMAYPGLGHVHTGFMEGMEDVYNRFQPLLSQHVYVTGHSLGAARATLFCALLAINGAPARKRVVFGEPRSHGVTCKRLLNATTPGVSYRTIGSGRHDYVSDVPTDPPFKHADPLTDVAVSVPPHDDWGIFALHHSQLYQAGIAI